MDVKRIEVGGEFFVEAQAVSGRRILSRTGGCADRKQLCMATEGNLYPSAAIVGNFCKEAPAV